MQGVLDARHTPSDLDGGRAGTGKPVVDPRPRPEPFVAPHAKPVKRGIRDSVYRQHGPFLFDHRLATNPRRRASYGSPTFVCLAHTHNLRRGRLSWRTWAPLPIILDKPILNEDAVGSIPSSRPSPAILCFRTPSIDSLSCLRCRKRTRAVRTPWGSIAAETAAAPTHFYVLVEISTFQESLRHFPLICTPHIQERGHATTITVRIRIVTKTRVDQAIPKPGVTMLTLTHLLILSHFLRRFNDPLVGCG